MNLIKNITLLLMFGVAFVGCEPEADPEFIYPKEYLPAYPGSYWDYTNGERILTSASYVSHSYEASISSIENTGSVYVPMYNNEYLYEYTITQNSTEYPTMKLLEEKIGNPWTIRTINGEAVKRQMVAAPDSLIIPFPPYTNPSDSVFKDILVVVEFIDSLGVERWNLKEYYAKNVGLVRVEANNPLDTLSEIVIKEIQAYKISN